MPNPSTPPVKVSILVPTYNRGELLKKALQSILDQSFTDFEIIVTDNSPTNEAELIVAGLNDARIRYSRNETNVGAVNNHNKALRQARGEYIYLFSDDDIMLPDNLQEKVAIMDAYPNVGLVHSNVLPINEHDIVSDKPHWTNLNKEWKIVTESPLMKKEVAYQLLFNETLFICMPAVLLRKKILDEQYIEFNNQLKYMVDWDLFLKMSLFCDFYCIDKKMIKYRFHGNNETYKLNRGNYFLELLMAKLSLDTLYRKVGEDYPEKGIMAIYSSTMKQIAWWQNKPATPSAVVRATGQVKYIVKKYLLGR